MSRKFVGKGRKLELVDGPRGKALRVTAGGPNGTREGFDLTAHVDALAVEEGKPFTLAVWVRTDDWDSLGARFVDGQQIGQEQFRFFSLYRFAKGIGYLLQQGKPGGGPDPQNQSARGTHAMTPIKGWIHLAAVSRDDKRARCGTVAVNGASRRLSQPPRSRRKCGSPRSPSVMASKQGVHRRLRRNSVCSLPRLLTAEEIAPARRVNAREVKVNGVEGFVFCSRPL